MSDHDKTTTDTGAPKTVLSFLCPMCGSWIEKTDQRVEQHLALWCEPIPGRIKAVKNVSSK